ncbi:MAG: hypothetical protein RL326_230, partial [Pseudomonadota bacterium]
MGGQLYFSFPEEQEIQTETNSAPAPIARQIHEAHVDPLRVAQIKHELDLGNSRSATLAATVLTNRLTSSGQELDSLAKAREMPLPNPSLMKNFDIAVAAI